MDVLTNAFFYCVYQKNVVPLHEKNIFRSRTMKHLLSIVLIAMVCIGCEPINIESGKNDGRYFFSVSDYEKVVFSPGNLQYHIGQKEWRFAENQTDFLNRALVNPTDTFTGWIDKFYWSRTSCKYGLTKVSSNNNPLDDFVDWGNNKIGNDAPYTWRTLAGEEWYYLCSVRTNAQELFGIAQVNGVNGLILLPDNWKCPRELTFQSGFADYKTLSYADHQTFTMYQWKKLEQSGAIFLPIPYYGSGAYWSSTKDTEPYPFPNAYYFSFSSDAYYLSYAYDIFIFVRLVKDF